METRMINKIRKKDSKGLDYIINAYSKKVYFLVYKIIGQFGKEEVEECVSDVFYKVWENINEYDENKGDLSTFIFIKTKYLALDYKRRLEKKNLSRVQIHDGISNEETIENTMLDKENSEEIIRLINDFKEPDKTYFYLRYFMYYKIDEISDKYQTTRASVENRLYRCRIKIKEFLEGRYQDER